MRLHALVLTCGSALACQGAMGDVTLHTTYASWSESVGGGDALIDFNLGSVQLVTEQYADLGAHFLPGSAFASPAPVGDGWIATTLFPAFAMTLDFDLPQYGVAADLGGKFKLSLFSEGTLIYESQLNEFTSFRGVTSTTPFDRAVFASIPAVSNSLDNIYFGTPIPGPGAAAILGAAALLAGRRRRRT